jgi:hypothetical protein
MPCFAVCVCVYTYVCMYVYVKNLSCVHIRTYIFMSVCIYPHTHRHMQIRMHTIHMDTYRLTLKTPILSQRSSYTTGHNLVVSGGLA